MSLREKFAHLVETAQSSTAYWRDIAITDFVRDLHARMTRMNVSHAELAARMGTSRPYVTKLLNGGNFTLETMVKLATALDGVVRVHIEDRDTVKEECQHCATVPLIVSSTSPEPEHAPLQAESAPTPVGRLRQRTRSS